ncbi:MAG: OmpA family protein [Saprospiraceae bacterium]|nr:OmpA family protein [Saprospiraceae bacterium]
MSITRYNCPWSLTVLVCLLVLQACQVAGQGKASVSRNAQKSFDRAQEAITRNLLDEAEPHLLDAIEKDPQWLQPRISLGALYFAQADWSRSKIYFESVIAIDSLIEPMVYYKLGEIAWKEGQYPQVLKKMNRFLADNKSRLEIRQKAKKYLRDAQFMENHPPVYPTTITPLPNSINSQEMEYLPSLPAREDVMIFTRRIRGQEDFYSSKFEAGQWQPSVAMTDLNTVLNEGAHSLSADGKMLIFTACDRSDGLGSCDLYYSVFDGSRWSKPANLGPAVNSRSWDGQPSLSANGKTLFFSSERSGGGGSRDLWMINRKGSGWDTAINLSELNTDGNEEVPFIHASDESLYFMSDGHPGFGGTDLFIARRGNEKWQPPVNLGMPINTAEDEGALHVNLSGTTAYFARTVSLETDQKKVQIDIFEFPLPQEIRPIPATYASIQVLDRVTKRPLQSVVEMVNLATNKSFIKTLSNKEGEVLVCLPLNEDFALNISKENYAFHSEHIQVEQLTTVVDPFQFTILLSPIELDAAAEELPIVLNNVFFESGSAELEKRSEYELNQLYEFLKDNLAVEIEIRGHTDDIGSDIDNQVLSELRAKAIYDYLVTKSITGDRLRFKGFGETLPIAENISEVGRMKNRRTEFLIVNGKK